jgi:hypothetical protein
MTDYPSREAAPVSMWAISGITFAGSIMILVGTFHAIGGLAAIFDDKFYVVTRNYAYDLDVTAWGWLHLIMGVIVAFAGYSLFTRKAWAATFAVFVAMLSAITNFFFIPYYPFWSLLEIALAIWVIWALTRPGAIEA